jgi:beta-phosphoglucomutase family hydrolase
MNSNDELTNKLNEADALIFDLDGTLIDSMPLHFEAWCKVTQEYRLPFTKERFYQLGGVPTYETLIILSNEAGKRIDLQAATTMKESLFESFLPEIKPIKTIVDIVKAYSGIKPLAVATGSNRVHAEEALTQLSLMSYFDAVVTSDDIVNPKPAPDVFLLAAKNLEMNPAKCVGFEDTDLGLQSIKSAGMAAVDIRMLIN